MHLKTLFFFSNMVMLVFILVACGADEQEAREMAIDEALILLTDGHCNEAIAVLEAVGRDNFNSEYLQTLSSAYACKAGFNEITFFASDISNISGIAGSFLGELTLFSTSQMTDPSDHSLSNLIKAIDILLYAGDVAVPTSAYRAPHFSSAELGDMNAQALWMLLAALGNYSKFYGNADPVNGAKGDTADGFANTCYMQYSQNAAKNWITFFTPGTCDNPLNTGHPALMNVSNTTKLKRSCQGVTLFNKMLDTLGNTLYSADTGSLGTAATAILTLFSSICRAFALPDEFEYMCQVYNQNECEASYASYPTSGNCNAELGGICMIEIFFAAIFDTLHVGTP